MRGRSLFGVIVSIIVCSVVSGGYNLNRDISCPVMVAPVQVDERLKPLQDYLVSKGSPLADCSMAILDSCAVYDVDYRLLVAIAGMESGFGKHEFRKNNSWGWGSVSFKSRKEGIGRVARYLSKHKSKSVGQLGAFYCPPNKDAWVRGVNKFSAELF